MRPTVGFVFLGLLLVFTLLNLNSAHINFFFILKAEMPVAFVIFFSAALGGMTVLAMKTFKAKKKK